MKKTIILFALLACSLVNATEEWMMGNSVVIVNGVEEWSGGTSVVVFEPAAAPPSGGGQFIMITKAGISPYLIVAGIIAILAGALGYTRKVD